MRKLDKTLLAKNVGERIKKDIEDFNIAGARAIVAQGGEVLLDEVYGSANAMTGEPLKRGAMFRLASLTKPIAGFAFLLGIQKGYFGYNDLLIDHFPEFASLKVGRVEDGKVVADHSPNSPIRLHMLLSQSSGFCCNSDVETIQMTEAPSSAYASKRAYIDYALTGCLGFDPGEGYGYSQTAAFDVIALLIEKYSGKPYHEFLEENLFAPLGIKDITYFPSEDQWNRTVAVSDRLFGGKMVSYDMGRTIFEAFPLEYAAAGAGLLGSAEDYFKFGEMLRCRGVYNGVRLIDDEIFSLYYKHSADIKYRGEGADGTWGLGVYVRVAGARLPEGAYGWSGAYDTHFFVDPENDITAVYMKNNRWHDAHGGGKTGANFETDVMASLV